MKTELSKIIDLLSSALVIQCDVPDQSEILGINRDGVDGCVNGVIAAAAGQCSVLLIVPGARVRTGVVLRCDVACWDGVIPA